MCRGTRLAAATCIGRWCGSIAKAREASDQGRPLDRISIWLSPDGTRVALDVRDQENDIWIWIWRGRRSRADDAAWDLYPVWTPDGQSVIFIRRPSALGPEPFRRAADGTGTVESVDYGRHPAVAERVRRTA